MSTHRNVGAAMNRTHTGGGSRKGAPAPRTAARRRREAEGRRQAILDAAWRLFLAKGIAGTSVDDIARECELAKGTIYLYFKSKEEIAFSHLLESTENLLDALRKALDPKEPAVAQLKRLAATYYRFFRAQPESFRYMFIIPHESYRGRVADELVERWGRAGRQALGLVAELLERAGRQGQLRVRDPWSAAVGLWSAITGVIAIPSQGVRRPFIGEVDVEALVNEIVDRILSGMAPGGSRRGARGKRGRR